MKNENTKNGGFPCAHLLMLKLASLDFILTHLQDPYVRQKVIKKIQKMSQMIRFLSGLLSLLDGCGNGGILSSYISAEHVYEVNEVNEVNGNAIIQLAKQC